MVIPTALEKAQDPSSGKSTLQIVTRAPFEFRHVVRNLKSTSVKIIATGANLSRVSKMFDAFEPERHEIAVADE